MIGDAFNDGFSACTSSRVSGILKDMLEVKNKREAEEEMDRARESSIPVSDVELVGFAGRNAMANDLWHRSLYRNLWMKQPIKGYGAQRGLFTHQLIN